MSLPGANQPQPPADAPARRRLYWYLLPIVLLPVLLIASAFVIIPSDWFSAHTGSSYLANLGYGATLHNQSCQVLIYGDSTAMVGVQPAIITQQTGLTACNIAEFEGMTMVSNTLLVDRFLTNNPRPRYIVFLYAPEDLNLPDTWRFVSTFEATTYMVGHERSWHTARILATHPVPVFDWAEQGLRLAFEHVLSKPFAPETRTIRARLGGQFPIKSDHIATCDDLHRELPPDRPWLDGLRARYGIDGTTVLIDATPTIPCDLALPYVQQHYAGVIDNTPYRPFPIDGYTDDGRLHANALGTTRLSNMIARQIAARMQQEGR